MNPRVIFEAMMRGKNHTDFEQSKTGKYVSINMQTRWNYFLMGWEMRGAV